MATLDKTFTYTSATHEYSIKYTALGPPSATPLIFIHGTPWSHQYWLPYAKSFASSGAYHVYLFDNPGYGISPAAKPVSVDVDVDAKTDLDASLTGQTEAFAALFKHWGSTDGWAGEEGLRPHVIAHDNAGLVALRATILHGCEYASLCLIDVVAVGPFGSPFFRLVAENVETFKQIPDGMFKGLVRAYIEDAAYRKLDEGVMGTLMQPWLEEKGGMQGKQGFVRQMVQADGRSAEDVEGRYGEVGAKMRVKIVWGRDDGWIPVERAERLREMIGTREKVVVLEECGHLVHYDQPERLGVELGLWIGGQVKGDGR